MKVIYTYSKEYGLYLATVLATAFPDSRVRGRGYASQPLACSWRASRLSHLGHYFGAAWGGNSAVVIIQHI